VKIRTKAKCPECERVFDLLDEDDANEWYYGHDCEAS
jgi:NOL1/NOP2/fmu family ribosome biogenesis protein